MTHHTGTRIASAALPLLFSMAHASLAGAQVRPATPDTTTGRMGTMRMAQGAGAMMTGPHHALAMAYRESLATFARAVNADASTTHTVNVELAKPATVEMRRSFEQMKLHHSAHMAAMSAMSAMSAMMPTPMAADSAGAMMRSGRRDSMTRSMPAGERRKTLRVTPPTPPMRPDSMTGHPMSMPMPMPMPMRTDSLTGMGMGDMASQLAGIEKHLGMIETEVNATTPDTAHVIEHTAEILKLCAAAMPMPAPPMMGKPRTPGTP